MLIAQRAQWMPAPWSEAIWPILGSMFMFRLIVYLYDLRHDDGAGVAGAHAGVLLHAAQRLLPALPGGRLQDLSGATTTTTTPTGSTRSAWTGWCAGVIHLLLYRVVYYYFTLAPSEVHGPGDLAQYLVANFLLYLRVSGQFHLIVGMLHLFGFRLPETHHLYFLASSFTDFWRRINIYWKDFMMKVFYYPAYFKLRRLGNTVALVLATLFVFLVTWFLHSYQWFWLRGTILFVWQDILFWTILGLLVVRELAVGSKARPGAEARQVRPDLAQLSTLTLKTVATFCFICILWSFWTTESMAEWFALWKAIGEHVAGTSCLRPFSWRPQWWLAPRSGGRRRGSKLKRQRPVPWRSHSRQRSRSGCSSSSASKASTETSARPSRRSSSRCGPAS